MSALANSIQFRFDHGFHGFHGWETRRFLSVSSVVALPWLRFAALLWFTGEVCFFCKIFEQEKTESYCKLSIPSVSFGASCSNGVFGCGSSALSHCVVVLEQSPKVPDKEKRLTQRREGAKAQTIGMFIPDASEPLC
jgi:hypothetical protein